MCLENGFTEILERYAAYHIFNWNSVSLPRREMFDEKADDFDHQPQPSQQIEMWNLPQLLRILLSNNLDPVTRVI